MSLESRKAGQASMAHHREAVTARPAPAASSRPFVSGSVCTEVRLAGWNCGAATRISTGTTTEPAVPSASITEDVLRHAARTSRRLVRPDLVRKPSSSKNSGTCTCKLASLKAFCLFNARSLTYGITDGFIIIFIPLSVVMNVLIARTSGVAYLLSLGSRARSPRCASSRTSRKTQGPVDYGLAKVCKHLIDGFIGCVT